MPFHSNYLRKSFIPDLYKRISSYRKSTPYFKRRISSPSFPWKNNYNTKKQFASDSQVNSHRISLVSQNPTKLSNIEKNNSDDKNENGMKKKSKCLKKSSNIKNVIDESKVKNDKDQIVRRKSEHPKQVRISYEHPRRGTFAYRRSNSKPDGQINSKVDDLTILCQLVLLRTVTPKPNDELSLNDPFEMHIDETYFVYYPYIFKHLLDREKDIKFNNNYLVSNGFHENFRCTLIDWLIKVQVYSKISSESLQIAIVLVDMFISFNIIKRSLYQLVGITGLLIACKVVQRYHPRIKQLCYLTEDYYLPSHVVQMESMMLEKLKFFVNVPIPMNFCHRGLLACIEIMDTDRIELFCNFLFDLITLHSDSPGIRSSCKSAAAIFIARLVFYPEYCPWTKILQHYTLYNKNQLKDCSLMYLEILRRVYETPVFNYKAVIVKYSQPIYKSIAKNEIIIKFATNKDCKQLLNKHFDE